MNIEQPAPTPLTEFEQMVGKAVSDVRELYGETLCIHFTDGTCLLCSIEFGADDNARMTVRDPHYLHRSTKHELGLISDAEYQRLNDEFEERRRQEHDYRERAEYDRLKAKFEGAA